MLRYALIGLILLVLFLNEKPLLASSLTDTFDIQQYQWLVGHWKGNGFGGISEEIWAPPIEGTMMGMYRHSKEGKVTFYEFMLLSEDGLHLKHFHPDLRGWEEKDDFVTFATKSSEPGKIFLKGLTFEKVDEQTMQIRLNMKEGDKVFTEIFDMTNSDTMLSWPELPLIPLSFPVKVMMQEHDDRRIPWQARKTTLLLLVGEYLKPLG